MANPPLEALLAQIQSLPGEAKGRSLPRPLALTAATERLDASTLRARTAALLTALAAKVEATLPMALRRAAAAWDQADDFDLLDDALCAEAVAVRGAALAAMADPALRAAGTEAQLMIDAAFGLVGLFERRFAAVVRLRLRSATPELLVDGRPFCDLAAALAEAAQRWR